MATHITAGRLNPLNLLSWWLEELAGLVPGVLRRGLGGREQLVVVERSHGALITYRRAGTRQRETGRIDLKNASDRQRRRVANTLAKAKRSGTQVVLRLPSSGVLERHLELPAVADADLRRALYFEIDRQTPFRPEETYFDYKVTGRNSERKRLNVDLTIIPRKVVEDAVANVDGVDLSPDFVELLPTPDRPARRIPLRGSDEKPGRLGLGSVVNIVLVLVILAELAMAVRLPLQARGAIAAALATEVHQARERAEATRAMQKELEDVLETKRRLQQQKLQAPSVVAVLEELTRLLPDDVWLMNLQLSGGEVRLSGFATTAATLVALLDASPMFQTPKFNAPVTQDLRVEKERFSLSFNLEPKDVPAK